MDKLLNIRESAELLKTITKYVAGLGFSKENAFCETWQKDSVS